jgi:hypothetical protein
MVRFDVIFMVQDKLKDWLQRQSKPREILVNPNPYENGGRMDDPTTMDPQIKVLTEHTEPVTIIRTISDRQFKKLTGENPQGLGEEIRVDSPSFTTQPQISIDAVDLRDRNAPQIRVIEGGAGVPDTKPFVNPFTSTNPNSMSSLLAPGKADTRGMSTTNNYDEMKRRMDNVILNIDGENLDILLPTDITDTFSGTKINIGGVPGMLTTRDTTNGFFNKEKIGTKHPVSTMDWDGQDDKK